MKWMLVPAALVLLLSGCVPPAPAATPTAEPTTASSSPTAPPTPGPTPNPSAFTPMDPSLFYVSGRLDTQWGGWDTEDVNFTSPSGNLGCAILGPENGSLWGCAIEEREWDFPTSSSSDYCYDSPIPCGGGIEVTGDELPHPRKRGDPGFPGAFGPQAGIRILQYGESVTFGNVTCFSEEIGVTCENSASGHGFVIARDRNDIY